MRPFAVYLILFSCAGLSPAISRAATCSCAGVPLLSAIDTSSTQPGDLFFSFTSELHEISTLVQGSKEIKDATRRQRSSLAQVLSLSYGLAENWSVSGLVSYVEHRRKIGSSFFGSSNSSGLGDGVILFRYTPIYASPLLQA